MSGAGYIAPVFTAPIPQNLTLTQFLQTVFTGISGLGGTLVRPKWQPEPPKNPDIGVNWMAFGVDNALPDDNGFYASRIGGDTEYQRHETLEIVLSIYGPEDLGTYGLLRDGFQIPQNRATLFQADMGFVEITRALRVPEKVNERWIDRIVSTVFIRRQIKRFYRVLTLESASGTVLTDTGSQILTTRFKGEL